MKEQLDEVIKELYQANFKHNLFVSEHEGMGVLQEEVYELWDAIRSNKPEDVYHEATQVAAMAVKLMMYLDSARSINEDICGVCKNKEGFKIKAGCKTFFFCEECLAEGARKLEEFDINDEHECLCDNAEETEIEILRRKHRDCMNREKYGDAFDSMFGNFELPKI